MELTPLEQFAQFPFDKEKLQSTPKGKVFRKYWHETILTETCMKPVLEYLMKDNSANQTASILSPILGKRLTAGGVIGMCRYFGIKTHTFFEAANLPSCRKLHEETNLQRYGAINTFCKGTPTYAKKIETVQRKYGVDNIRKSAEFQTTRKNSMMQKYGVTNAIHLPWYCRNAGRRSKIQKEVENILTELSVPFEFEVPDRFRAFNPVLQREYSPIVDILLEQAKVVLEVYGDRWHANPKKYKASDIIPRWDGEVTASHIWELDKIRTEQIKSFGYKVVELWECDIRYSREKVVSKLKTLLGIT